MDAEFSIKKVPERIGGRRSRNKDSVTSYVVSPLVSSTVPLVYSTMYLLIFNEEEAVQTIFVGSCSGSLLFRYSFLLVFCDYLQGRI